MICGGFDCDREQIASWQLWARSTTQSTLSTTFITNFLHSHTYTRSIIVFHSILRQQLGCIKLLLQLHAILLHCLPSFRSFFNPFFCDCLSYNKAKPIAKAPVKTETIPTF